MGFAVAARNMIRAKGSTVYIIPGAAITTFEASLTIDNPNAIAIKARWSVARPNKLVEAITNIIRGGEERGPSSKDRLLLIADLEYPSINKTDVVLDKNGDQYEVIDVVPEYGIDEVAYNNVTVRPVHTRNTR